MDAATNIWAQLKDIFAFQEGDISIGFTILCIRNNASDFCGKNSWGEIIGVNFQCNILTKFGYWQLIRLPDSS